MNAPPIASYLDERLLPYPFCPGCGHGAILDQLNQALVGLQLDPHAVVLVTDIGCSGLSDRFFTTNAFHGLHGRSVTYASGIKLANPSLKPIVIIGDGGCGIGGHHLINAARRNIGVTVLVFNNFNYGMTGGQQSVTTPAGGVTSTTPGGSLERPMDICSTVAVNGASFVARTTSFDKDLHRLMAQAIECEGFALIDIWELCTSYYVPSNKLSRQALFGALEDLRFPTGVIHHTTQPEFSQALHEAGKAVLGQPAMPPHPLQATYQHRLDRKLNLVLAGAAGARIGSAAAAFSRGAVLSGLWATQRHDYPVTVRTGHSVTEVVLSPEEILFPGIEKADVMLVLFPESLNAIRRRLEQLTPEDTVYVSAGLAPLTTAGRQVVLDFSLTGSRASRKPQWAVMALAEMLRLQEPYPLEAFQEALRLQQADAGRDLEAIDASRGLGGLARTRPQGPWDHPGD